jgi:hypothetical protein
MLRSSARKDRWAVLPKPGRRVAKMQALIVRLNALIDQLKRDGQTVLIIRLRSVVRRSFIRTIVRRNFYDDPYPRAPANKSSRNEFETIGTVVGCCGRGG